LDAAKIGTQNEEIKKTLRKEYESLILDIE
jgi:hypothetical protein